MRYPCGNSNEDFLKNWYNAQPFGTPTDYGFHEGDDLNLKTGGDSDLGQPLYAPFDGRIVYYHNGSHPTTNFGRHMVVECNTPRGKRWFHYAHCQEITAQVKDVKEGEVIGKLGKSGTTAAHLHFSLFVVDPATLPAGIDSIAKTQQQLGSWESAIGFLSSISSSIPQEKTYSQAEWQAERDERNKNWDLYQQEKIQRDEKEKELSIVRSQFENEKDQHEKDLERIAVILDVRPDMAQIIPALETCIKFEDQATDLQKKLTEEREKYEKQLKALSDQLGDLEKDLQRARDEIERLKLEKPETAPTKQPTLLERLLDLFVKGKHV